MSAIPMRSTPERRRGTGEMRVFTGKLFHSTVELLRCRRVQGYYLQESLVAGFSGHEKRLGRVPRLFRPSRPWPMGELHILFRRTLLRENPYPTRESCYPM